MDIATKKKRKKKKLEKWNYFKINSEFEFDFEISDSDLISYNTTVQDLYVDQNKELNITVDLLDYFTNFSISTHICNEVGCGLPSEPIFLLTAESYPTCPPDNITVINTTSTSFHIRWDRATKKCYNGEIIGYYVNLKRIRDGSIVQNQTTSNEIDYRFLEKYEMYCVIVAAFTKVGIGNFSSHECAYTDEDCK